MDSVRTNLIKLTAKFVGSWFPELGASLYSVKTNKLYKDWTDKNGFHFNSFTRYCRHDLHIGSTVASDIARAYEFIKERHKDLLSQFPSDGKIVPGYNEIIILIRSKKIVPESDHILLESKLFSGEIGRHKLREIISDFSSYNTVHFKDTVNKSKLNEIQLLKIEIRALKERIQRLEALIKFLRKNRSYQFQESQLVRLRKDISKYIHPDIGGDNELMRDFNSLMDNLMISE